MDSIGGIQKEKEKFEQTAKRGWFAKLLGDSKRGKTGE